MRIIHICENKINLSFLGIKLPIKRICKTKFNSNNLYCTNCNRPRPLLAIRNSNEQNNKN